MKFRGRLTEPVCIKQFIYVINTVSKLAKVCTLRITETHLYFIVLEASSLNSTPGLWCELQQTGFFSEYNMEGVSAEHNEIYLEIRPESVMRSLGVLRSGPAASSLKLKLTRRHAACLTLEVEYTPSGGSGVDAAAAIGGGCARRLVTHDVPVTVLQRRLWAGLAEPSMPSFQVSVDLPPLRALRSMVERMKKLGQRLTLSANGSGQLVLRVRSELATVATHFESLRVHPRPDDLATQQQDADLQPDRDRMYDVQVDIKPFAMFLAGDQLNPAKAVCNIVEDRMLHLFLIHDDITLQYFIPGIAPN